jgi:hypothetical protein
VTLGRLPCEQTVGAARAQGGVEPRRASLKSSTASRPCIAGPFSLIDRPPEALISSPVRLTELPPVPSAIGNATLSTFRSPD